MPSAPVQPGPKVPNPPGALPRFTGSSQGSPTIELMATPGLVLITAPDCHLCSHARSVMSALSLEATEVDIASPEAQALAGRGVPLAFLPVLWDGARIVAYGRLSEKRLRRELSV